MHVAGRRCSDSGLQLRIAYDVVCERKETPEGEQEAASIGTRSYWMDFDSLTISTKRS